jgi:flagellar capping protein FliD
MVATSPFQVTGVASGISWDEIINTTLEMAKKPATIWQSKIDTLEYKRSLYQELVSKFETLRNTFTNLKLESTYKAKTPEYVIRTSGISDASNILKATVNASAEISSWDINVSQLAQAQRHISARQSSSSAALGITGSFRIQVDAQVAVIEVKSSHSLSDIQKTIQSAVDQNGNPLLVSVDIIDNRLVVESVLSGLDNTGPLAAMNIPMSEAVCDEVTDVTDTSKTVKDYITYLPRVDSGIYPSQLLSVASNGITYRAGYDYDYDATDGSIKWYAQRPGDPMNTNQRPAAGDTIEVAVVVTFGSMSRGSGDEDNLQTLPSGEGYSDFSDCEFSIVDADGVSYTGEIWSGSPTPPTQTDLTAAGADFMVYDASTTPGVHDYRIYWSTSKRPAATPTNVDGYYDVTVKPNSGSFEYARNKFYMEEDSSANSVLVKLGIKKDDGAGGWEYDIFEDAQNAEFTINGVPISSPSNTIDAESDSGEIIPYVSLELTGEGRVTLNITQDASKAVEGIEAFAEAYNDVMTWINERLSEKYDSNTIDTEDDYLQSILSEGKGKTVFGTLHGDQLLSSIKNQLRSMLTNSISTLSSTLRSRKVSNTSEALNISGAFYVNTGGNMAKIVIEETDSLVNIQRKLQLSASINNNSTGTASANADMDLEVEIENGQLVIKRPSDVGAARSNPTVISDSLTRSAGSSYAYLKYVPDSSSPINGKVTVSTGSEDSGTYVEYVEGTDYKLESFENDNGMYESRLVWLTGGNSPAANTYYNVSYSYNPAAVSFTAVSGESSNSLYTLDFLDLHYDQTKVQPASYGLGTEGLDYGKSGLIDLDTDAFFAAIQEDSQQVSNVMVTFMTNFDSYISNLTSSSQVSFGSAVYTKGRIAAALNSIDSEVSALNDQITKLETQLAQRQETLYKQYSNMEVAIQKLNAQMSSITQFMETMSSSS